MQSVSGSHAVKVHVDHLGAGRIIGVHRHPYLVLRLTVNTHKASLSTLSSVNTHKVSLSTLSLLPCTETDSQHTQSTTINSILITLCWDWQSAHTKHHYQLYLNYLVLRLTVNTHKASTSTLSHVSNSLVMVFAGRSCWHVNALSRLGVDKAKEHWGCYWAGWAKEHWGRYWVNWAKEHWGRYWVDWAKEHWGRYWVG